MSDLTKLFALAAEENSKRESLRDTVIENLDKLMGETDMDRIVNHTNADRIIVQFLEEIGEHEVAKAYERAYERVGFSHSVYFPPDYTD
jgi:predicted transcriptional regulator YheO